MTKQLEARILELQKLHPEGKVETTIVTKKRIARKRKRKEKEEEKKEGGEDSESKKNKEDTPMIYNKNLRMYVPLLQAGEMEAWRER